MVHQSAQALEIENMIFWKLSGEIVTGDCDKLLAMVKAEQEIPYQILIDSNGGNIQEAMCIADFIRENVVHTDTSRCASACLIVWGAGVERMVLDDSEFGFHRPSFTSQEFAKLEPNEAQLRYSQMLEDYRALLRRLDFSAVAIDKIIATKSSEIEIIIGEDIYQYIPEHSPGYQEWEISKCGEITDEEHSDFFAVEWLDTGVLEKSPNDNRFEFGRNKARYAKTLPSGYLNYLRKAVPAYKSCVDDATEATRKKYIEAL